MSRLYQRLRENALSHPDLTVIVEGDTRWSSQEFLAQVNRAANGFQSLSIRAGERVGLMMFNQKEFLVCFFALRQIGAVVVPINIQMLPQDIGFIIQNAGMSKLIVDTDLYKNVESLPLHIIRVGQADVDGGNSYEELLSQHSSDPPENISPSDESDLAFLIYTSGTSGHPKGVMLSEKNVLSNIEGFGQIASFDSTDRIVLAIPLFHAYGLILALTGALKGSSISLIPKFSPKGIMKAMISEDVTVLPLVPTLYTVILSLLQREGGIQLKNLRFCISGGASLPSALLEQIESALSTVVLEGYGMTETSPVISVNDPAIGSIPNCVGKPLPNVSVKIFKDDGSTAAPREEGEVCVKGDNVMLGYFNLPEETQATLTPDGWLKTGDLGYFDEAGNLYISGRKKDLIIKAGENIAPLPIEEALYRHEAVHEASVIGLPDDKHGETIAACIGLKEGASVTPAEIVQHCRGLLNNTYIPDQVIIFQELPKNPTGKIVKKTLKAWVLEQKTETPA